MCEIPQIPVSQIIFEPAYSSVQHDVLESPVLEHVKLRRSLEKLGALSLRQRQVAVEEVVAEGKANWSAVNTADSSKETAVVVIVVVTVVVVVETGSDSKVVDSKLV